MQRQMTFIVVLLGLVWCGLVGAYSGGVGDGNRGWGGSCYLCHNGSQGAGSIAFDSYPSSLVPGESGALIELAYDCDLSQVAGIYLLNESNQPLGNSGWTIEQDPNSNGSPYNYNERPEESTAVRWIVRAPEAEGAYGVKACLSWRSHRHRITDPITIMVLNTNRAPVITGFWPEEIDTVGQGTAITFSAQAMDPDGDALTWEWTYGVDIMGDLMSQEVTFTREGADSVGVLVTDPGELSDDHVWYFFVDPIVESPAANRPVSLDLSVGPVPSRGMLRLRLLGRGPKEISVMDLAGRTVRRMVAPGGFTQMEVDLDIPNGCYLVLATNSHGEDVRQWIVLAR